jgi:hypothetical protein
MRRIQSRTLHQLFVQSGPSREFCFAGRSRHIGPTSDFGQLQSKQYVPAAEANSPVDQLTSDKRPTMQLSRRLARYVPAIAGGLEASIKDRTNPDLIDLALAENRICQSEILEIYKAALENSLETNACSIPATPKISPQTDKPF